LDAYHSGMARTLYSHAMSAVLASAKMFQCFNDGFTDGGTTTFDEALVKMDFKRYKSTISNYNVRSLNTYEVSANYSKHSSNQVAMNKVCCMSGILCVI
jgi:hypothetical protein